MNKGTRSVIDMTKILMWSVLLLASCTGDVGVDSSPTTAAPLVHSSVGDDSGRSALGTNILEPSYWSSQLPLIDLFKYSAPWVSGDSSTWDNGQPIATDASGWVTSIAPGQIVRTVLLAELPMPPTGRYVMTWQGNGAFTVSGGCTLSAGETTAQRAVLIVTGKVLLYFTSTDVNDYMRNIRITEEAHETSTATWHPAFVNGLTDVACLRWMDLTRTNHSSIQDWSDRPKISDARYTTTKGMPYELAVDMCNTLMKDAWLCVPHQATDAMVTSLADMVRDNLNGPLTVYIEYSNEVWNNQFEQAAYCETLGINSGLGTSAFQARLFYYSRRAVDVFNLFTASFGGTDRIVRVMASQAGNSWTADQVLSHQQAYKSCDALAVAPYFNLSINANNIMQFIAMSDNDLLDYIEQVSMPIAVSRMHQNANVSGSYGLPMIAYEGGQHVTVTVPSTYRQPMVDLMMQANRNQRMHGMYLKYLDSWMLSGGNLFVHYNHVSKFSQWGCWGSKEWQGQPLMTAPKARALHDFNAKNKRWW